MSIKLLYNLWKQKRAMKPSKVFKAELWEKLENKLDPKFSIVWYRKIWFRTSSVAMAGVMGFTSIGTGVYAYASPNITEGNILYPIKQSIERVEGKVKINPQSQAKFLLKKAERREQEKKIIVERVKNLPVASTTTLEAVNVVEIVKTEKALRETDDELVKVKEKLKDDNEDGKLRKEIEKHLERRQKEIEKENEREKKRIEKENEREEKRLEKIQKMEEREREDGDRSDNSGRGSRDDD